METNHKRKEVGNEMRKHKLGSKAITAVCIFSLLIVLATCITVVMKYKKDIISRYSDLAVSYTKIVSEYIDGDKVPAYVQTLKTDDYYEQVKNFLNIMQKDSDLKYLYVFIPQEDDLIYVWDADLIEGYQELGAHENYMEGGKEASFAAFSKNPTNKVLITKDEMYGYIVSAFYPVFDSNGDPIALVGVDFSMPGISQSIMSFVLTVTVNIIGVIILLSTLYYVYVRHNIIHPIGILNKASKELVSNLEKEEEFCVSITTGDEIEELAQSFVQMNQEVKEYIQKLSIVTAEKERIGTELNLATQIQASMLPSIFPPFPDRTDIDIYATMKPAKEVGGDFYDFFLIDQNHLGIVMADVSGKGVPAALFMVIAKTLIKNRTLMGGRPSEILEFVNNQLCEGNDAQMFVTVWLGILDLDTGILCASNAGHEYPIIKKAGGNYELFKDKHGFVLAGMEDVVYKDYELELKPGDMLYLYTDGVVEATDDSECLFGAERLLNTLNENVSGDCRQVLEHVMDGIHYFVKDAPQFDDITMLAFKFFGRS